jgi:hypothetical protein
MIEFSEKPKKLFWNFSISSYGIQVMGLVSRLPELI